MLAGITALGERSRGRLWPVTFLFFSVFSILGGAVSGAFLGATGSVLAVGGVDLRVRLYAAGAAALVGGVLDLRLRGLLLPSIARQVNGGWMTAYRGWVYGAGFGFQLGGGLSTVVIASATYLCLLCAALTGSPLSGAVIMGAYGAVRGLSLLPGAFIRRPSQLARLSTALTRSDQVATSRGNSPRRLDRGCHCCNIT